MKRLFFASAAVSMVLLAATGCAPKPEDSATPTAEATPATAASPAASPAATPAADAKPDDVTMGPPAPSPAGDAASGTSLPPFKSSGNIQKTASGLQYDDMIVGTGPQPKAGQYVHVHYIGTLENGTKFDSSY